MADSKSPLSLGFGGSPGLGIWHPSQWRPTLDNSSVPPAVIDGYSTEVLADGPLVYYRMDEASGTTAYDSSGWGRHGTYVGTPTLGQVSAITAPGTFSVKYGPGTSRIERKHETVLNVGDGPFTIEFWAKQTTGSTSGYVTGKGTGPGQVFYTSGDAKIHIEKGNTQATAQESGTSDTNWHHWVFVQAAGAVDMIIYKDGVAGTTVNNTSTFTDSATPLEVGGCFGQTQFDGYLDEYAYYNTALSSGRVTAHYNAGVASSITVTPPVATLVTVLFAPSIPLDVPASSLVLTTFAPSIRSGLTVPLATLVTATFAPSIVDGRTVPLATLVTATFAPSIPLDVPKASLVTTTFAPSIVFGTVLTVPLVTLVTTTFAPSIPLDVPKASLVLTTFAPVLPLVIPPLATLVTTTFAPSIVLSLRLDVPLATLVTTTFAPTLVSILSVPLATLVTTTFAPGIVSGLTVPLATLVTSTKVPSIISGLIVPTSALTLTTLQPQAVQSVPNAVLVLTTFVPGVTVFNASSIIVPTSSMTITRYVPVLYVFTPADRLTLGVIRQELFPRRYRQRDHGLL